MIEAITQDYQRVEDVLQRRREQYVSVAGKYTPFRVEFRYRGGMRHYQYFTDLESARIAKDRSASYGPTGRAVIEYPYFQQIQVSGPRSGWKAWKDA